MTKIKGLSVIQCREYIVEQHGVDTSQRVQAAMHPEARSSIYSESLLPTDWIELSHALEHSLVYDRIAGTGDGQRNRRMIRELTTRHAEGLYKSVLTGDSPRTMLERAGRLWSRYYDRGETRIEALSDTALIKRIVGCPDLPRHHDWLTTPYYDQLLRHAGAKDIFVKHTKCVADGADCCETELRWRLDRRSLGPFDM